MSVLHDFSLKVCSRKLLLALVCDCFLLVDYIFSFNFFFFFRSRPISFLFWFSAKIFLQIIHFSFFIVFAIFRFVLAFLFLFFSVVFRDFPTQKFFLRLDLVLWSKRYFFFVTIDSITIFANFQLRKDAATCHRLR